MKKKSSLKSRKKMGENAKKPGKIGKKALNFSIFGKIHYFFRKSYVLVPFHGGKKWRRKSGKNSLRKSFREIVEKHTKNCNFGAKMILSERILQDFRIFKKFGSQSYVGCNAMI